MLGGGEEYLGASFTPLLLLRKELLAPLHGLLCGLLAQHRVMILHRIDWYLHAAPLTPTLAPVAQVFHSNKASREGH